MSNTVRSIIRKILLPLVTWQRFLLSSSSILKTSGWLKSYVSRKPVDANGSPIPWMNYAAIDFLRKRLRSDFDLFEWGSGYSTLFFSEHVSSVTSVEYDSNWFELVRAQVPKNAQIIHQAHDQDGYVNAISTTTRAYKVVVVDGRERVRCFSASFEKLTEDGVIILDDSNREKYQSAFEEAEKMGFKRIDFIGLKPRSHRAHQTTVFYRPDNCLGI
jgi:precorrin-6B methylase 2